MVSMLYSELFLPCPLVLGVSFCIATQLHDISVEFYALRTMVGWLKNNDSSRRTGQFSESWCLVTIT